VSPVFDWDSALRDSGLSDAVWDVKDSMANRAELERGAASVDSSGGGLWWIRRRTARVMALGLL
jgi:hypothetical protein